MESVANVATNIWNDLAVASPVESPLHLKTFFDAVVKEEDPCNRKDMVEFKIPT